MTDQQWQQAWAIYRAARELPDGQRTSYLSSISADPEVFEQVILLIEEPADPSLAASDLKAGTRIGHYEVLSKLGRGGMGQVYTARDTELGRELALKLLAPEFVAIPRAMERLIREARATSALNHPHIVTVYEVVRSGDDAAIAMELVEGESLRSYCGKPQPIAKVLAWGRQIAQALAAAHARNIVHRDIKPENLMVRPDGYIKVLDFGLAGQSAPAEQSQSGQSQAVSLSGMSGTLNYMAPEQIRAERATSATDVFSLGIVLYEIVTGTHPFLCDSPIDTAEAIATGAPKPPAALHREIPLALNSLLLAMLAKDACARPSALEVDRRLSAIETAGAKRLPRRLQWLIGSAAACLVVALALRMNWQQLFPPKEPVLIQLTKQASENRVTAAALSPDGKTLAFARLGDSVHLRRMSDGLDQTLSTPADFQIDKMAWFADGTKLVASGFSLLTNVTSIWIISKDEAPRLLREHAREAAPSPDGTAVAFVTQDWSEIWVIGVNGEKPRRIAGAPIVDSFPAVFWSPDSRRVSFQHGNTEYSSTVAATAKKVTVVPNVRMSSASALPDGRIVFLQSNSSDSGVPDQLWEVKTDPATGGFLGPPHEIAGFPHQNQTRMYGMSSTADGKHVVVVRGSDRGAIFVGDLSESPPRITRIRRLTRDGAANDYPHAWTADSRAVIFESNRKSSGIYDLYRQDVHEPAPKAIAATPLSAMLAQLGPDGHQVLYAARDDNATVRDFKLMRVPVEGGNPQEVPIGGPLDEFRCALEAGKRCVLRTALPKQYYVYYDLDPILGKGRELARTRWSPEFVGDWDISPDGTQVAFPDHDSGDGRIRVISLAPSPNEPREHEVALPGSIDIHGLVWAPSGHGWFAAVRTTFGYRMLYVYLNGKFVPLADIQGWAVPSPDGRRVAFWNHTVATNAWLIERR